MKKERDRIALFPKNIGYTFRRVLAILWESTRAIVVQNDLVLIGQSDAAPCRLINREFLRPVGRENRLQMPTDRESRRAKNRGLKWRPL